jgi:hypothetical protein
LEAPLSVPAAKAQKPAFPTGDLDRTATVFAALLGASGPRDAQTIAKGFHPAKSSRPSPACRHIASPRLGHIQTTDGYGYALRRALVALRKVTRTVNSAGAFTRIFAWCKLLKSLANMVQDAKLSNACNSGG